MARRRRRRFTKTHGSLLLLMLGLGLLGVLLRVTSQERLLKDHRREATRYLNSGNPEAAMRALERALTALPQELDGRRLNQARARLLADRGVANLRMGRPEHALQDLREARALQPGAPSAWMREGQAYLDLGRHQDAALLFEEASLAFPAEEQYFRYAAAGAHFASAVAVQQRTQQFLQDRAKASLPDSFAKIVGQCVGQAPGAQQVEALIERFLPRGEAARSKMIDALHRAQESFLLSDEMLDDFEVVSDWDPAVGEIRVRQHFQSGRYYEGKRAAEILLKLDVPAGSQVLLHGLLADLYYDLDQHGDAANELLAVRQLHIAGRNAPAARQALLFAAEEFLRDGNGRAALNQLRKISQLRDDDPVNHFLQGYSRFLDGGQGYQRSIQRAAEILARRGFRGEFRNTEQKLFIFSGLIECLLLMDNTSLALTALEAGQREFPSQRQWGRQRAVLLRQSPEELPQLLAQQFRMMHWLTRRPDDLARWEQDSEGMWPSSADMLDEILREKQRLVRRFETGGVSEVVTSATDLLGKRDKKEKKRRQALLERTRADVLGRLRGRPFVALQVYRLLLEEEERDQAYLLLHALWRSDPSMPHFRYLLARHEWADGDEESAADHFAALFARDSSDLGSGSYAWHLYRRLGLLDKAREVELGVLNGDPAGAGRLFAMQATLDDGYPELALQIGRGSELGGPLGLAIRGVTSRAHLALGDLQRAREIASEVLEEAAIQPLALGTALALVPQEQRALDYLFEHEALLRRLPEEQLLLMGREFLDGGYFALAERILRLALNSNPFHIPVRLALIDALLGMDRYGEAGDLLEQLGHGTSMDEHWRRAYQRLRMEGVASAYDYLRIQSADFEARDALGQWLILLASARGRLPTVVYTLRSDNLQLSVASQRFLIVAMQFSTLNVDLEDLPDEVAVQVAQLLGHSEVGVRDRDVEQWLSVAMQDGIEEFSRWVLPVVLLADIPDLRPLWVAAVERAALHYPELGSLVRDWTYQLYHSGERSRAVEQLVKHLLDDPADELSLRMAMGWSEELSVQQLDSLVAAAARLEERSPVYAFFEALRASVLEDATSAVAQLGGLHGYVADAVAIEVARLRIRERELLYSLAMPLDGNPYQQFSQQAFMERRYAEFDRILEEAAIEYQRDPAFVAYVVDYLERRQGVSKPRGALLRTLMEGLFSSPSTTWPAYRLLTSALLESAPSQIPLEQLGGSLREAIARHRGVVPIDAVEALTMLGQGLRAVGAVDSARSLVEEAYGYCPYDSRIVLTLAQMALDDGEFTEAIRLYERSLALGDRDARILTELAEQEFFTRRDLAKADELAQEALLLMGRDELQEYRARAMRLRGYVAYLRNQTRESQDHLRLASRALDENPDHDLDAVLQAFVVTSSGRARSMLQALGELEGPHRTMVRRLLAALGPAPETLTTTP